MIHAQNCKFVSITPPAAIVDDASYTTASIDTAGYDYMQVFVYLGATDIAAVALKLQSSDTDGSYADLPGAVYGTSANIAGSTSALPSADDGNECFLFEVNLLGKKRYFDLVATAGNGSAGTYMTAFALLWRGDIAHTSAANRGFADILRVA